MTVDALAATSLPSEQHAAALVLAGAVLTHPCELSRAVGVTSCTHPGHAEDVEGLRRALFRLGLTGSSTGPAPGRPVRMHGYLWDDLGRHAALVGKDRTRVITELVSWWLGHPDAELPARPSGHVAAEATS